MVSGGRGGKRRNKVGEVQRGGSNDAIRRVMQNDVILRSGVTVLSQGQHVQGPAPSDPFLSRPPPPFLAIAWKPAPLVVAREFLSLSLPLFVFLTPCPSFSLLLSFSLRRSLCVKPRWSSLLSARTKCIVVKLSHARSTDCRRRRDSAGRGGGEGNRSRG